MSTTIDEKVVELKFDNRQFETNVRQSMSTLEKLSQALTFKKPINNVDEVGKAVNNIDMNGLASAVQTVSKNFSALEVMGVTALVRITNAAISTGERLVKSLSVDQLTAGWSKYEEKTTAVQTIMAATREALESTGNQMEIVSAQLDKLNWFTDETSYNFTDMVSNIGKFTSAGIGLQTSVEAMEGIATWAAMAGQNAGTASRVMYNLSQAIGQGSVKLMDWKSVENANMGTIEFKKTVMETAVELGVLKKTGEDTYATLNKNTKVTAANFRETLSEGWFTNDVLLASLQKYSMATEKLNEMSKKYGQTATNLISLLDDYSENTSAAAIAAKDWDVNIEELTADLETLGSSEYELGLLAFRAAQEAKTFTDAIDATKDAVSTGWMKTFEYIFGNYEETKELWTDLCDVLWEVFAASGDARNEMLGLWYSIGGREQLIKAVYKAFSNMNQVFEAFRSKWDEIFDKNDLQANARRLDETIRTISKVIEQFEMSAKSVENLEDSFGGLFSIIKFGGYTIKAFLRAIYPLIFPLQDIGSSLLEITGAFGRFITGQEKAAESADVMYNVFSSITRIIYVGLSIIAKLLRYLVVVADRMNVLSKASNAAKFAFSGLTVVGTILLKVITLIAGGLAGLTMVLAKVGYMAATAFKSLMAYGYEKLVDGFKAVKEALASLFDTIKNSKFVVTVMENFSAASSRLSKTLNKTFATTEDGETFFDRLCEAAKRLASSLWGVIVSIKDFITSLTPAQIISSAFAATLIMIAFTIMKATSAFSKIAGSAADLFEALTNRIKTLGRARIDALGMAIAIGALTASLYVLSTIDTKKLLECLGILVVMSAMLVTMSVVFAKLNTSFVETVGKLKKDQTVKTMNNIVAEMAGSILVLVGALKILETVDTNGIWSRVGVLMSITAGLAVIAGILAKVSTEAKLGGVFMISFSLAIMGMVRALEGLVSIKIENLQETVVGLITLMTGLSILSYAAKGISIFSAAGILGVVLALQYVIPILEEMSQTNFTRFTMMFNNCLETLMVVASVAVVATVVGSILGKGVKSFGAGMLMLSVSIVVMSEVIKQFQAINVAAVAKGTAVIVAFSAMMAVFYKMTDVVTLEKGQKVVGTKRGFGWSMIQMAGAIAIMGLVVDYLKDISVNDIAKGTATIVAFMGMMAVIARCSIVVAEEGKSVGVFKASLVSMMITLGLLTAEVFVLTSLPLKDMISGVGSLCALLLSLSLAMRIASTCKPSMKAILTMYASSIVLVQLSAIMITLTDYDWGNVKNGMIAMTGAMVSFAICLQAISLANGLSDFRTVIAKVIGAYSVAGILISTAIALKMLTTIGWTDVTLAVGEMAVLYIVIAKLLGTIQKMPKTNFVAFQSFAGIALMMATIAFTLNAIPPVDTEVVMKLVTALIVAASGIGIVWLTLKAFSSGVDKSAINAVLLTMASVAILVGALSVITRLPDVKKVPNTVKIVMAIALSLGGLAVAFNKIVSAISMFKKPVEKVKEKVENTKTTLIDVLNNVTKIVLPILALAVLVNVLKDATTEWSDVGRIAALVASGIVSILLLSVIMQNGFKKPVSPTTIAAIGTIAAALLITAEAIKILGNIPVDGQLIATAFGLFSITILLGVLAAAMNQITIMPSTVAMLGVMSLSFVALTGALTILRTTDTTEALINILNMFTVVLGLAGLVALISKIKCLPDQYLTILSVATLLASLGIAFKILDSVNPETYISSILALGASLIALWGVIKLCDWMFGGVKMVVNTGVITMLGIISGSLLAVSLSLSLLAKFEWYNVLGSLLVISTVLLGIFAVCMLMGTMLTKCKVPVIQFKGFVFTLITAVGSLLILALLPYDVYNKGIVRLFEIMSLLVGAITIIGLFTKQGLAVSIGLGVTILSLVGSLMILQYIEWGEFGESCLKLVAVLGMLGIALVIIKALGLAATTASVQLLPIITTFGLLAGLVGVIGLTLRALAWGLNGLAEVDWDGIKGAGSVAWPLTLLGFSLLVITTDIVTALAVLPLLIADFIGLSGIDWNYLSTGIGTAAGQFALLGFALLGFALAFPGIFVLSMFRREVELLDRLNVGTVASDLYTIATSLKDIYVSSTLLPMANEYIKGFVNSLVSESDGISTAANMMSQKGFSLGSNLIEGLKKGIISHSSSLNSTVVTEAQMVIGELQSQWGIHSPSRVTQMFGSYLMQGASMGIASAAPNTVKTAGKAGTAAIKAFSTPISSVNTAKIGATVVNKTGEGVAKATPGSAKIIGKSGEQLGEAFVTPIAQASEVAAEATTATGEVTSASILETVKGVLNTVGSALDAAGEAVWEWIQDPLGIGSIQEMLQEYFQNNSYNSTPIDISDMYTLEMRLGDSKMWQESMQAAIRNNDQETIQYLLSIEDNIDTIKVSQQEYYDAMFNMDDFDLDFDFDEMLSGLGNVSDAIGGSGGAAEEVDEFAKRLEDLHNTIESQIDIFKEYDRTIDITKEDVLKSLSSQISGVNEWSNKLLVLARRGISQGLLKELSDLGPNGYKYVETFIQMTSDELESASDMFEKSLKLSSSSTMKITAAMALAGDEASKAYIEGFGMNMDDISDIVGNFGNSLKLEEANTAILNFRDSFVSLYDTIKGQIKIFEEFNSEVELTGEDIIYNMQSQIEGVMTWSENLKKLASRGISEELLEELSNLGPDGYEKVAAFVEMTDEQIRQANDLFAQSLELPANATAGVISSYAEAGNQAAQDFINALGSSTDDIYELGKNLIEGLANGLFDEEAKTNMLTTADNVGEDLLAQFMTTLDEHSPSKATEQDGIWLLEGLGNGLENSAATANLLDSVKATANNVIDGFAEGLINGGEFLCNIAMDLGHRVLESVKGVLGIHSPSVEFGKVGMFSAIGFANGLKNYSQSAEDAAESMGTNSLDALRETISKISAIVNGEMDDDLVIRPTLDLSDIRAGAQQLNGLIGDRQMAINGYGEVSENQNGGNGGMTFIQNNYSPKALSRIDIYRQTKNQFATMKGLVNGT